MKNKEIEKQKSDYIELNQTHDKIIGDISQKYMSLNELIVKKSCNDLKNVINNQKNQLSDLKLKLNES